MVEPQPSAADTAPVADGRQDLSALAWVHDELRRALESAHKALRRHLKEAEAIGQSDLDSVDPAVLRSARNQIHQGVGALELVGLPALAQVLRAAEAAVQRLVARPALLDANAVGVIEGVSFALLDAIARRLAGKPVSPVALFPQVRAALQLAGADRIHPADLWTMDWNWRELPPDASAQPRAADDAARAAMEQLTLALMRGVDTGAPARMSDLCAELAAGARGTDPRGATLWQLAAAVYEAQAGGLLAADVYTKRVASRLLAQLRAGQRGTPEASERLAQDLLFFCAHADAPDAEHAAPRLAAVRRAWRLEQHGGADYETARLGRFDPALLSLARKRVASAKDAWSAVAGGELHRLAGLAEQFALVGESLRKLFPAGDTLDAALQAAVESAVAAQAEPAPALAMEVATAMLYVEASLEDGELDDAALAGRVAELAQRIHAVREGAEPPPLALWMEELYRRVSDRQTMGSVVQELRASLSEVEKQIDAYFRNPAQREQLIPVPAQLSAMRGVFSVLGLQQASAAVLHMRDAVDELANTEVDPQRAIAAGTFDRLADNLGALSFLIDMLSVQPQLAKTLFRFDPETGLLSAVMAREERPSAFGGLDELPSEAAPAEPLPAQLQALAAMATQPELGDDELAARIERLAQQAAAAEQSQLARQLQAALRQLHEQPDARAEVRAALVQTAAALATPLPAPPPPSAPTPPPAEVDDELREIFLEESREVIGDARAALQRLAVRPDDLQELTAVRRAFHTLKGSSRMVGLRDFGEAAWACEQLYNARLASAPSLDPALQVFTAEALGHLGDWTEAVAEGRDAGLRPDPLVRAADALRLRGERLAIADALSETRAVAAAPVAETAADGLVLDAGRPAPGAEPSDQPFEVTQPWPAPVPAPAAPADAPALDFEFDLDSGEIHAAAPDPLSARIPDLPSAADLDLTLPMAELPPATAPAAPAPVAEAAFDLDLGALEAEAQRAAAGIGGGRGGDAPAAPPAPADFNLLDLPTIDLPAGAPGLPATQAVEIDAASFDALFAPTEAEKTQPLPPPAQPPEPAAVPAPPLDLDLALDLDEATPGRARPETPAAAPGDTQVDLSFEPPAAAPAHGDLPAEPEPAHGDPHPEPEPEPELGPAVAEPAAASSVAHAEPPVPAVSTPAEAAPAPAAEIPPALPAEIPPPPPAEGPAPADDEPVKVIGPLRIPIPLFNIFLNEADERSRRLCTELAEWALEHERHPLAESSEALAHGLAGASGTVGYAELSALARALEHALMRSRAAGRGRAGEAQLFVDAAEEIRRLLHQFAAGFLRPVPPELLERLAEHERLPMPSPDAALPDTTSSGDTLRPAEGLRLVADAARGGSPLPRAEAPEDEIDATDAVDPELFEIFEEEADELLPRLQASLRDWHERPADGAPPAACMRVLHTFKGGARLAGAMRLGEMAHRLESAIEHLTAHGASPGAAGIEPLLARADAMANAFAALRDAPRAQPGAPAAPPPLPVADAGDAAAALPADLAPPDAALPHQVPQPADRAPAIDWARFVAASPAQSAEPPAPEATVAALAGAVRVRAALLDRLVNQAGEVSIARARIEADLRQMQGALGDLGEAMERMRRQLRDIELQAETQISSRLEAAKAVGASFDPLEMDRYTRFQELTRFLAESVNDVGTLQRGLQRTVQSTEDQLAAQARLTRELQDDLLRTRMVEFESLAERLYRTVRQASKETGKPVRLDIEGGAIEVDRGVLERMAGSFEHLLRNAVAHGIEDAAGRAAAGKDASGRITISVAQAGNEVALEFADDGGGLDLARIRQRALERGLLDAASEVPDAELGQLIFEPGFSTAAAVTELAGRGVGLDVVRAEVVALGGRVETLSEPGQGTRFRLLLPLTTAVTQVVELRCGTLHVAVPANLIEIVRRIDVDEMQQAYDAGRYTLAGEVLPFYWLPALLGTGTRGELNQRTEVLVVVRSASQRVALHVDEVVGNQEVVVKNVGPQLARVPGLTGVTLLPSGAVSLIYNPVALAGVYGAAALALMNQPAAVVADGGGDAAPRAPLVLVVDDSLTVRRVTQRLLLREGYRVVTAKDGLDALEKLAAERPVVLLSDIEMPRMDGFDLLRNVRADSRLAGLPVVMITSRTAQKHRDVARELGADHYLGKPFAEEELLSIVARHAAAGAAG